MSNRVSNYGRPPSHQHDIGLRGRASTRVCTFGGCCPRLNYKNDCPGDARRPAWEPIECIPLYAWHHVKEAAVSQIFRGRCRSCCLQCESADHRLAYGLAKPFNLYRHRSLAKLRRVRDINVKRIDAPSGRQGKGP